MVDPEAARSLAASLEGLASEVRAELDRAATAAAVEELRVRVLGRKAGRLTGILRGLKDLPADERPAIGALANRVKEEVEVALDERIADLDRGVALGGSAGAALDVTVAGRRVPVGHLHPVTRVRREIEAIFVGLGFAVADGPEIEDDWHNFEALAMPADHPARDAHDTFYLGADQLLRTHTSPVQIRLMRACAPPLRAIMPGRVFRRDHDVTHSPTFHQVEGLAVDDDVSLADLRGVLTAFLTAFFGPETRVRFRPSFFPFTEPSAEVDVGCVLCGGNGCRVCKGSGWLEVLGCGLVDPAVFAAVGYDAEAVSGYAFGMGVERLAMLRYGIPDLRLLFENDLRFLTQL